MHGPQWLAAMSEPEKAVRQKYLLDEIVDGYTAIVDGPGCFFVEDWVEAFLDAKVFCCQPPQLLLLRSTRKRNGLGNTLK